MSRDLIGDRDGCLPRLLIIGTTTLARAGGYPSAGGSAERDTDCEKERHRCADPEYPSRCEDHDISIDLHRGFC
jgi:hypothetical protein